MTKLTKRQQEILALIQSHMAATGSPPTRAEIAKTMGFRSPNAAEDHLRALARKGVIELVPGTSRGIRLTRPVGGMPIVKSNGLTPGQPLLSDSHIIGTCKLDRLLFHPSTDYLLHLTHKSFPTLDILEGDYLAIQKIQTAQPGQIVLIANHELVVQRYNQDLQLQSVNIEGLVVGVIRSLTKSPLTPL